MIAPCTVVRTNYDFIKHTLGWVLTIICLADIYNHSQYICCSSKMDSYGTPHCIFSRCPPLNNSNILYQ